MNTDRIKSRNGDVQDRKEFSNKTLIAYAVFLLFRCLIFICVYLCLSVADSYS